MRATSGSPAFAGSLVAKRGRFDGNEPVHMFGFEVTLHLICIDALGAIDDLVSADTTSGLPIRTYTSVRILPGDEIRQMGNSVPLTADKIPGRRAVQEKMCPKSVRELVVNHAKPCEVWKMR